MRKFNGKYYFIYSSLNSHNLCYAVSNRPDVGFEFGGILVSCGDIGLPGVPDVKHARASAFSPPASPRLGQVPAVLCRRDPQRERQARSRDHGRDLPRRAPQQRARQRACE